MVIKITSWSYLEPLLFREEWVHLSEISKVIGKNHSVARKYLNEFEEGGILDKKNIGKMTFYKIKDNLLSVDIISLVEKLKLIEKSRDLRIKEITGFLHNNLSEDNKALIFGSSVLDAKKAEDIDILITGKINFMNKVHDFEKIMNKKIHIINVKNLNVINATLKKEIKSKHLIIQGTEEIIKWLI